MGQLEKYAARYLTGRDNAGGQPGAVQDSAGPQLVAPTVVVAKPDSLEVIVSVDTDLLREARQLEEHAARLLGQWRDKHEHPDPGGRGPIPVIVLPSIVPLDQDEIQDMALPAPTKR